MENYNMITASILLIISFSKWTNAQMVPAMFVFGDSLVDVGNNNYLPVSIAKANFPHNGVDFPNKKPTGRFSNGKNAADVLAQKLGLPSSPPYLSLLSKNVSSYMTGVSFASAGSGIFNGSDLAQYGQSIPLALQVSYYGDVFQALAAKMGPSGAKSHISKSLFFVVIGSNDLFDYSNSSPLKAKYSPRQYADMMATSLGAHLEALHASGANKFAIAGVGPIGCIPSRRAKSKTECCDETVNSYSETYNARLKFLLQQLKSQLAGFSYSYFDTYSNFKSMIQTPAKYGFAEVKAACCGAGKLKAELPCLPVATYCPNREDHLFWDLYHPTERTDTLTVDVIFDGPSDQAFPVNVRQLGTV